MYGVLPPKSDPFLSQHLVAFSDLLHFLNLQYVVASKLIVMLSDGQVAN